MPLLLCVAAPSLQSDIVELANVQSWRQWPQAEAELAAQRMPPEEVQRRQDLMAKNNALLFYQELKAKRVKKIKSKAYHRHLKKQALRTAERLGAAEGGAGEGGEAARVRGSWVACCLLAPAPQHGLHLTMNAHMW